MIGLPDEEEIKKTLSVEMDIASAKFSSMIKYAKLSDNEIFGDETLYNELRKYYIFLHLNTKDMKILGDYSIKVAKGSQYIEELIELSKKEIGCNADTRDAMKREMLLFGTDVRYAIKRARTINEKQDLLVRNFRETLGKIKALKRDDLKLFIAYMEKIENDVIVPFKPVFDAIASVIIDSRDNFNRMLEIYKKFDAKIEGENKRGN